MSIGMGRSLRRYRSNFDRRPAGSSDCVRQIPVPRPGAIAAEHDALSELALQWDVTREEMLDAIASGEGIEALPAHAHHF
jgi:hypothetical protein